MSGHWSAVPEARDTALRHGRLPCCMIGCPVAGFAQLFSARNVKPLTVGLSLMLFQQITGQPSVLYYAGTAPAVGSESGVHIAPASPAQVTRSSCQRAMQSSMHAT